MFGFDENQACKEDINAWPRVGVVDSIRPLQKLEHVLRYSEAGIFKRIDENRELMELLQKDAPEFVHKHPWVMGWLESQDNFLSELAQASGLQSHHIRAGQGFPCPYPLKRKIKRSIKHD